MERTQSIDLVRAISVVRRRGVLVLAAVVIVAAAAYGLSHLITKRYSATAAIVFTGNNLSQQVAGLSSASSGSDQTQQQQDTNLQLVKIGDMAAKTAAAVGAGFSATSLYNTLSISNVSDTNVVDVTATTTSPTLSQRIANTYTRIFVNEQANTDRAYYQNALSVVLKQLAALPPAARSGAAGLALQNRAQALGILAELRSGTAAIAQVATKPNGPSAPRPARNAAIAGVLALFVSLGIAFLVEGLDRVVREPEDLQRGFGLPLLGTVPLSDSLARSVQGPTTGPGSPCNLEASEVETFQLINAYLRYFNVDRDLRTLLVTSAMPGDGKSTVSGQLAAAGARLGSRVLFIDADLRRGTASLAVGAAGREGLADVLIGACSLSDASVQVAVTEEKHTAASDWTYSMLPAGAGVPPNPASLLESRAMEEVLDEARGTYDMVIIDSPPLTAVSDAFPLLGKVDGVIVVGRVGRDRTDAVERTRQTLEGAGAPTLGVIANGVKSGVGSYGRYDYAKPNRADQNPETVTVS